MQESSMDILRRLTIEAYSFMDCKKALVTCDLKPEAAAKYLTDGNWRSAKLISWNHSNLDAKAKKLELLTCLPTDLCRKVLMDCAGNIELAQLKLTNRI